MRQPSSWAPGRASTGRGPTSPRSIGSTSCCVQRCRAGLQRAPGRRRRGPAARRLDRPAAPALLRLRRIVGLEIGVLGDLLASCFDVNLAVWAGAASEVEDQAVRWVSEFIAYPAEAERSRAAARSPTSALAAAPRAAPAGCATRRDGRRFRRALLLARGPLLCRPLGGAARPGWSRFACSQSTVSAASPEAVAEAVDADRAAGVAPVAVVATAGTTLTGAVDPIDALADVCEARGVWLHVDGAYGVAAASTPSAGHLFAGVDRADSVTLDAHKWLFAQGVRRRARPPARRPPRGALHEEDYIPRTGPNITWSTSRSSTRGPFRASRSGSPSRARGRGDPRGDRAQSRPGPPPLRGGGAARRPRAPLRRAALSIVPFRTSPRESKTWTTTMRCSSRRCRRTGTSGSRRRASTARSACGRASSTTARPTTTCARSSASRASRRVPP